MTMADTHDRLDLPLAGLRSEFDGEVIAPGDAGYDQARTVFIGGPDRRPVVILRPAGTSQVARVVTLARESGLPLAVRCGGHSLSRYGVCDDGIVLDLSLMRALDIDVEHRTAWAQTGLTAGAYTAAVGAYGLATGFGDTGTVGIGGLTLGGGIGYLVRKHGLTIDNLLAAEVVTAHGEVRHIDAATEPELFWAIRGGGANFGVVTRMKFRLHEIPTIVGGMLMLPATPKVVVSLVEEALAAPDELTVMADIMVAPPLPFVPPEHHGTPAIMIRLCYAGATDAGERAVARLRGLAPPIVDLVRAMPYRGLYEMDEEYDQPLVAVRSMFVDSITLADAETIIEQIRATSAPMASVELRPLGGAMARVHAEATAFAHRSRRVMATAAVIYKRSEDRPRHEAWVEHLAAAIRDGSCDSAYVNFLGNDGPSRLRCAYPGATWDRLVAIKRRYDPGNLFRLNHNIPPGGTS